MRAKNTSSRHWEGEPPLASIFKRERERERGDMRHKERIYVSKKLGEKYDSSSRSLSHSD